jgi:hypothetical protein
MFRMSVKSNAIGQLHCEGILAGNIIDMDSTKFSGKGNQIGQVVYKGHVLISNVTADANEKGQLVLRITKEQSVELMKNYDNAKNSPAIISNSFVIKM